MPDLVLEASLGKLRIGFDVSALGNAADIVVTASLIEASANESARVLLGTFPATATANAGILRIGVPYTVRASAALASSPAIPLAPPTQVPVTPTVFDGALTVTLRA